MGRLIAFAFAAALVPPRIQAQSPLEQQINEGGVCSRCHAFYVAEWAISKHRVGKIGCTSCHGESQGHVLDERNNVKPERIPRGAAIAGLCMGCHQKGCQNSKETSSCQNCHHVHALVAPTKSSKMDESIRQEAEREQRYSMFVQQGEQAIKAGDWKGARAAFRSAVDQVPGDQRATAKLKVCERGLKTDFPGFEVVEKNRDQHTGLPGEVRVAGLGIAMVVVPGGDFEMGSEQYANAKLIHTVKVQPFYLGKYEVTQGQWKA